MKTARYGVTALTVIILLVLFTACDNFFHELIPPDDTRITEFELNGQPGSAKTHISGNTIEIPWGSGMSGTNIEQQTIRRASVPDKASLLPLKPDFIQKAFPNTPEAFNELSAASDLAACIKELVKNDSGFNIPAYDKIPLDFSVPVPLLVINGRGTVRLYTARIVVSVTFDSGGGSEVNPVKVDYGNTVSRPPDPYKEGHTFIGWYTENGVEWNFNTGTVTENITLYAEWEINKYTVTFDSNGGLPVPQDREIEYKGFVSEPPDPVRGGDPFSGWYWFDDTNEYRKWDFNTDTVSAGITLYAEWDREYTVTFEPNGGLPVPEDQHVKEGGKVDEPDPEPKTPGHKFGGWYKDDSVFLEKWDFNNDTVTADIILYAKWIDAFIVTFDSDHGIIYPDPEWVIVNASDSVVTITVSLKEGPDSTLMYPTINPPARTVKFPNPQSYPGPGLPGTGLILKGWRYEEENKFWNFYLDVVTKDMTLHAQWIPVEMADISGGTFTMGRNAADKPNETEHEVTLNKGFFIGEYQVTTELYDAVHESWRGGGVGDVSPALKLNWYEATQFCNDLSVMQGLKPYYAIGGFDGNNKSDAILDPYDPKLLVDIPDKTANGYRLPTEAEWEYAVKIWNIGYDTDGYLFEWCWDWYDRDYYTSTSTNPDDNPNNNPTGPESGIRRVVRGGLYPAYRSSWYPNVKHDNYGFRMASGARFDADNEKWEGLD